MTQQQIKVALLLTLQGVEGKALARLFERLNGAGVELDGLSVRDWFVRTVNQEIESSLLNVGDKNPELYDALARELARRQKQAGG